jgi:uncharacterized protein (TIGR03083 family)
MVDDLPYDPIAQIAEDADGLLAAVAAAGPNAAVEACPGWTSTDLLVHMVDVWGWWAALAEARITDGSRLDTVDGPPPPAPEAAAGEARAAADRLLAVLRETDPSTEIWTWTGSNQPIAWLQRRMAQETAVHRWDAERAAGTGWTIPPEVASDGIDEFLMWFVNDRRGQAEPVGGTVHLHCTDVPGEWFVRPEPGRAAFTREHAKGDAAVRGPAHNLLLWLWRRQGGAVEVLGDAGVAERFRVMSSLE